MNAKNETRLTRRAWMLLGGVLMTGCGGGGSGQSASLPGTGGTGAVLSQGTISGFGSVIVNGTKFNDQQAIISMDGSQVLSTDLRLGMVVEIQAQRSADRTVGTASSIEVWTQARGAISAVVTGGFQVSGMTILCDAATALEGFSTLADITLGDTVNVWALQNLANASQWLATRVAKVASGGPNVSTGYVQVSGTNLIVNGITLLGAMATELHIGTLVRVQGQLSSPTVMQLTTLRTTTIGNVGQEGSNVELEACITEITDTTHFKIGTTAVDTSTLATQLTGQLNLGDRVEVYGIWRSGILVASSVTVETEQEAQSAEITGTVSTITDLANFIVRGEICDGSHAIFSHGTSSDLKLGALVQIKGSRSGSTLIADSVDFMN